MLQTVLLATLLFSLSGLVHVSAMGFVMKTFRTGTFRDPSCCYSHSTSCQRLMLQKQQSMQSASHLVSGLGSVALCRKMSIHSWTSSISRS